MRARVGARHDARMSAGCVYSERPCSIADGRGGPSTCLHPTAPEADALAELLLSRSLQAVSIGCGEAYFEGMLEARGVPVIAVDLDTLTDPSGYSRLRRYSRSIVRVRPGELYAVPSPAASALCFFWGRITPWRQYLEAFPAVPLVAIAGDGSAEAPHPSAQPLAALTEPVAGALEGAAGWRLLWRRGVSAVHPQAELAVYERVGVNTGGVNEGGVKEGDVTAVCEHPAPRVGPGGVNSPVDERGCGALSSPAHEVCWSGGVSSLIQEGCLGGGAPTPEAGGGAVGAATAWGVRGSGSRSRCVVAVERIPEHRQWMVRLVKGGRGVGEGRGEGWVDAPTACLLDQMEWVGGKEETWVGGGAGGVGPSGSAAASAIPNPAPAAPAVLVRLRLPFIGASSVGVRVREVGAGTRNSPRLEVIPAGGDANGPADGSVSPMSHQVRLGHQEGASGNSSCPASVVGARAVGAVRLAAVALVVDPEACGGGGAVLLTRRPSSMRSFPRAWVLPGGGVDASDVGVSAAAVRELEEETGLKIVGGAGREEEGAADILAAGEAACLGTTRLLCLWESCYPVKAAAWAQMVGGLRGGEEIGRAHV